MRILFVSNEFPWPRDSGTRIRVANIVGGLMGAGDVDVFIATSRDRERDAPPPPPSLAPRRLLVVGDRARRSRLARLARWLVGRIPYELTFRRWGRAQRALRRFARGPYDLVWFERAETWSALHRVVIAPATVVDLDDLGDRAIVHHQSAAPAGLRRRLLDRRDALRWRRLHTAVAAGSTRVVVCSRLDADHLGVANSEVLPNGYEIDHTTPGSGVARELVADRPVLTMVGVLGYEPNRDAATWFVEEVLPIVRERRAGATFRLVGRSDPRIEALGARPGVELRGYVEDIGVELGLADVVVIPIRWGGGTRVKILEAFAYRMPVVSTTVGCEGLDVVDGVHLLVADAPESFAECCLRLVDDQPLRARLVDAGADLLATDYSAARLRERTAALARSACGSGP